MPLQEREVLDRLLQLIQELNKAATPKDKVENA